ncbi:MAG TPA: isoprenylcysteine carboxylmethyltransferase family protein [Terriglobales bacterium]|nr:isoprenylcysteine carboxylmethyltransferase family protein [Terriglobales bacterium]
MAGSIQAATVESKGHKITTNAQAGAEVKHLFRFRVIARIIGSTVAFAFLLFGPAGTWRWWRGWVIVGSVLFGILGMIIGLRKTRSGLLEERFKPAIQKGQPLADRILLLSFLATWFGLLAFTAADVFHLHLLSKPGILISSLGLVLVGAGSWIQYRAFMDNAFAAVVVRHQAERMQTVVDTGVYAVVRHPMYAGGIVLMIGTPLWLESYAAALASVIPSTILVVRILFEERFLRRELDGYEAYTQRVRYRLLPHVW